MTRIIAVANHKGGVGKTTTAVNLAASLVAMKRRVLLVDLDPQGNATTGLGLNLRSIDTSIYDVMMTDTPIDDCIEPTSVKNLFVAPATIDLAGAEIELVPMFSREAIQSIVIVVSPLNRLAIFTFSRSPFRRLANSPRAQPRRFNSAARSRSAFASAVS